MIVLEKRQHTEREHTEREGADVIWQYKLEREYDIDDTAFLKFVYYYIQSSNYFLFEKKRFTIWRNEFAARNDHIVAFWARLNHIVKDKCALVWMMDMRGKNSGATVLV